MEPVATTDANQTTAATNNIMGKEDFLNLLIAQLQNQDPLNPTDATEFTAQLAQFSSLEQLSNINENLETLQTYEGKQNNALAVSYIGKVIESEGNTVLMSNGEAETLRFELEGPAAKAYVGVYDSGGNLIKTLSMSSVSSGAHQVSWDGTDSNGNQVTDGSYSFQVTALDSDYQQVAATTYSSSRITAVNFKDGQTYLVAGDEEIALGDVTRVGES
jgi:flagellar basal-body rod modification protein FlgD